MGTRSGVTRDLRPLRGFSLLELLIVMAITLVVAAMAAPRIAAAMAGYELRQSASQMAGLLQRARIAAVQSNQPVRVRSFTTSGRLRVYVDLPGGTAGSYDANEPTIILPSRVSILAAGPGNPTSTLVVSANTTWNTTDPMFNGRGLPCVMAGAVCSNLTGGNQQGFKYYLKGDGVFGVTQWAAVVVTPGGRIKSLLYSGSSYN